MTKVLVSAATEVEIAAFINYLKVNYHCLSDYIYENKDWEIHVLATGVGMMAASYAIATALAETNFDFALQVGIAGAFDKALALGALVAVQSEQYGDLGAEDKGAFIDIFELGFLVQNEQPFSEGKLNNGKPVVIGPKLDFVTSLSVNTVSGTQSSIDFRKHKYNCAIESMEGIAFHYACLKRGIPFLQIRAISNYVTPRKKSEWNIPVAIKNLNNYLQDIFAVK